ncbi:MAG: hypothetical protein H6Q69_863 [Firmicutes bacterium]|nr:hypothetical protein [Bacillota bacterium]
MQNQSTKVSVILPTYNRPIMLKRAIESVLNQTYQNIEVIVVDDNGPGTSARDETQVLMHQYFSNKKVVYIKHDKNRNGAAARNTGIRAAKGQFISFLDDDDFYFQAKIEKEVLFLKKTKYMGVYCGRIQKGQVVTSDLHGDLTKELLCMNFAPTTSALTFRRQVLEELNGFDESYRRHQDYEFLLRYFQLYPIGVINEVLIEIGDNQGENARTGNSLEELKEKFLRQFAEIILNLECKGIVSKTEVYSCHYAPVFCKHLRTGHLMMAFKLYLKFFLLSPLHFNKKIIEHFYAYYKYKMTDKTKHTVL